MKKYFLSLIILATFCGNTRASNVSKEPYKQVPASTQNLLKQEQEKLRKQKQLYVKQRNEYRKLHKQTQDRVNDLERKINYHIQEYKNYCKQPNKLQGLTEEFKEFIRELRMYRDKELEKIRQLNEWDRKLKKYYQMVFDS